MKIFIVTSLIEGQDERAEVNVVGVKKTKQEAYMLMTEVLAQAKEMYEENEIDYDITEYENSNTIIIETEDEMERIEYNMFESEAE